MKTVILCGGAGTRIRDVTENLPKPMITVGAYPILWHIMKYYSCWGHSQFVLCLGYKGQVIKEFFLNYEAFTRDFTLKLGSTGTRKPSYHTLHDESDWEVTLSDTGLAAMTGARVKRIKKYVADEENFLLTYGDGVGDIDIDKLISFHRAHGKILTVTGVRPPGRFGELGCTADGIVEEFNEKPQTTGGLISGGFFVCNRRIFDYLDDSEQLVFEQQPMKQLVRDRQMAVFKHDGFWQPMDTFREYSLLNDMYGSGNAPWALWDRQAKNRKGAG